MARRACERKYVDAFDSFLLATPTIANIIIILLIFLNLHSASFLPSNFYANIYVCEYGAHKSLSVEKTSEWPENREPGTRTNSVVVVRYENNDMIIGFVCIFFGCHHRRT